MQDERVNEMQTEESQQRAAAPQRKRKVVLSPELNEVLQMLKTLEGKPAAG